MPEQNLQYDARHAVTVIYTAAVSKHRFVSWAGAHATDAAQVQGVSELAGATGKAGSVVTGYSYFVEAAAAIPAGSAVAPSNDGTGRAVVASGTQCGRALSAAAAAGELVVVRIRLVEGGPQPESMVSAGTNLQFALPATGKQMSNLAPILSTADLSLWDDLVGAGVTKSLDLSVTFNGQPTIRLDIPANFAGGTCRIGTLLATCRLPYGVAWDKTNFAVAIRSSSLAAVRGVQTVYLGDAAFANFFSSDTGGNSANQPQMQYADGDWMVFKPSAAEWVVGAGAPAPATLMRSRFNFNVANVGTPTQVWIGFAGLMPKRPKPTVILSPDDGFASWWSFLIPLLRYHRIPATFAITAGLVGNANYLTAAQVSSLANDPSGLFECINHNWVHNNVNQYGTAAAYVADVMKCDAALASWGVPARSRQHHAYPNSIWRDDVSALLAANGFKTARASSFFTNGECQDQMILAGDKLRWKLNVIANLQAGTTPANVQTAINTLKTYNGAGWINAHDFQAADGSFIYGFDNAAQVLSTLAAERDAGNVHLARWSDWYDAYCTQ